MIKSKEDYKYYLAEDKKALNKTRRFPIPFVGDEVWKFQRLLRKTEYINNCKGKLYKPYLWYLKFRHRKMSVKLGFTIPINVFGYGLSIAHYGTVVVNSECKIGNYCRIHTSTNIGGTKKDVPIIGDNVYIAPGVKIFGNIKIADGIKIGANSVVNKSFDEPNITIVGIPAKKVNRANQLFVVNVK